jgi:hypothetical protein
VESGDFAMPTPHDYREQAAECLELTNGTNEWYVKKALLELAVEFRRRAEKLERANQVKFAVLTPVPG